MDAPRCMLPERCREAWLQPAAAALSNVMQDASTDDLVFDGTMLISVPSEVLRPARRSGSASRPSPRAG